MEDLSAFATAHPEFCDSKAVRVPGHAAVPSLEGARPFELTADALSAYRVNVPKDPATLPSMLKMGPEAVAFYVSFRLVPDRWGIYVREGALRALKEEYHRIIWRDLGKYADRNVDDVAEKVETTLVLDYLLAHNRIHFLVDRAAAEWEIQRGAARSEEHTSELQSLTNIVCRLLLEKNKNCLYYHNSLAGRQESQPTEMETTTASNHPLLPLHDTLPAHSSKNMTWLRSTRFASLPQ